MTPRVSKAASLVRIGAAYALAVVVAIGWLVWGWDSGSVVIDALIADVLATGVIFSASRWLHNSSCYDAYWSLAPPLIGAYWWWERDPEGDPERLGLVALVLGVWSVRLTANWLRSFPGLHHEDWRYPLLRSKAPRLEALIDFGAIHLVPTLQVFAAMLPVYVVTRGNRAFGWLDVVAVVVGLGAVGLEFVADQQLHRFARTAQSGEVLDTGLWAWSRHPNYFGEWLFWVCLALFGLAANPGLWWWSVPGALLIGALLLGASIPMMEQRSLERRPEYASVIARVPRFFPRPPARS